MSDVDITTNEIWLPVVGFEGVYEVSSLGRVKRVKASAGARAGIIRKSRCSRRGYPYLVLHRDGKHITQHVARIVAAAFIGLRPSDKQINHKSGDKTDNRPENLEYVSAKENCIHRCQVLKKGVGEEHANSKLKNSDIPIIRQRLANGEILRTVAADYGVSLQAIYQIRSGRTWKSFDGTTISTVA